jgi:hypothetical protein
MGSQVIREALRGLFSVEGWMVLMLTLTLCGVIGLAQIRGLLRRILEELESRPQRSVEEDVPRIFDMPLE